MVPVKIGIAAFATTCLSGVSAATCNYPGGDCYQLAMQKCKEGKTNNTFTLHGLWWQGSNSCPGPDFDVKLLAPIMSEMEAKWLSCPEYGGSNEKFWKHEWEKHGHCARGSMSQLEYFKKGLSLRDEHYSECGAETKCA